MSLQNLKSIFEDELKAKTEDYISNSVTNVANTKLNYNNNNLINQTHGLDVSMETRGGRNNPILDSLLRGRVYDPVRFSQNFTNENLFVKPESGEITDQLFKTQTFDPRAPFAKEGTLYFNTNKSFNNPTNPTDFSTAVGNNNLPYTPLTELGGQFKENLSWENLYNSNHTPRDVAQYKGKNGISYGPNVNRDKLSIRDSINNPTNSSIFSLSRTSLLFPNQGEPYIVSDIPSDNSSIFEGSPGRLLNQGPLLGVPINRMLTDTARITKFLSSEKGLGFIAAQNFLGSKTGSKSIFLSKNGELMSSRQRFKNIYNPLATLLQTGFRAGNSPLVPLDKSAPSGRPKYGDTSSIPIDSDITPEDITIANASNVPYKLNDTFTGGSSQSPNNVLKNVVDKVEEKVKQAAGVITTIKKKSDGGDKMTLSRMITGNTLTDDKGGSLLQTDDKGNLKTDYTQGTNTQNKLTYNIEDSKEGMPFYFKDMRDNTYIIFRAFIEGLTENISPTYASHNYIGRSEPVYTYERGEREISMTLKLFAHTQEELDLIYTKMNRLTSLCYPDYVGDIYGNRMKPPLTKLRYGELFGKTNKELMGYIKSISYSVDQSSPYETDIKKRVPKHILATIGYQVIHDKAPRLDTEFYGYVGSNGKDYETTGNT